MTRHLGNLVPIDEVLQQYGSDGLRLFILTSHYRKPLTYTQEALASGKAGADRLQVAARVTPDGPAQGEALDPASYRQAFIEAMDDDLNTAQALAALFDLAREINRARDENRPFDDAQAALLELADVMGLTLVEAEAAMAAAPFVELLVSIREELRAAKQFELSDRIRDGLAELGVALEDKAGGTAARRRE